MGNIVAEAVKQALKLFKAAPSPATVAKAAEKVMKVAQKVLK